MGDVVEMNSEGFFASLVGLEAEEALARCKLRADEWREDIAHLQEKLGQTPRADKQGAHAIKQAILRTQSKLQRLKPVVASYRATVEKRETHSLWVDGVRAVCGHEALHEVYDWMAAEKKRRAQIARDAQAPQFSAPLPASLDDRALRLRESQAHRRGGDGGREEQDRDSQRHA